MSLHQTRTLIDHLDRSFAATPDAISPEETAKIQRLIEQDEDAAREWHYLQLAVDAVQDAGLQSQVAAVSTQYKAQMAATPMTLDQMTSTLDQSTPTDQSTTMDQPASDASTPTDKVTTGMVRNLYRNAMRVAACALLVAGGASLFKYVRLSSSSLYSEYYSSYDLNTSRGSATQDAIEQAYAEKNWPEVLAVFPAIKERSNKADFLAGIADLELRKFDDAIAHFEQVIATNSQAKTDYFEDEAEYYLAISWLAKNKVNEAMPMLEKIRADKGHLYHDKVTKMSFTDLRLVQYKENK